MIKYDLEDRTKSFAINVRNLFRNQKHSVVTQNDIQQVIRSSGSIGANYLEANYSLSKKDFTHRIRISRKEAKETIYWLTVLSHNLKIPESIINEATELLKILSAIYEKTK